MTLDSCCWFRDQDGDDDDDDDDMHNGTKLVVEPPLPFEIVPFCTSTTSSPGTLLDRRGWYRPVTCSRRNLCLVVVVLPTTKAASTASGRPTMVTTSRSKRNPIHKCVRALEQSWDGRCIVSCGILGTNGRRYNCLYLLLLLLLLSLLLRWIPSFWFRCKIR